MQPLAFAVREQGQGQKQNMLATLFVSLGVPMLLAGDEFGRTQKGNNNSFSQDNEISWVYWLRLQSSDGAKLHDFVHELLRLRRDHVVFRRPHFFDGRAIPGRQTKDITWLRSDGREMEQTDWQDPAARFLSYRLSGEAGAGRFSSAATATRSANSPVGIGSSRIRVRAAARRTLPKRPPSGPGLNGCVPRKDAATKRLLRQRRQRDPPTANPLLLACSLQISPSRCSTEGERPPPDERSNDGRDES